ncbi:PGF-CTERM sorting domain-containing protein [Paenibacillus sp. 481]|nr:hypothetical protein KIK04_22930 [Paenibacillus sp. 481]
MRNPKAASLSFEVLAAIFALLGSALLTRSTTFERR